MTTLSRQRIAELMALDAQRTPGMWRIDSALLASTSSHIATLAFSPNCSVYTNFSGLTAASSTDDAAFIAAAPEAYAQLRAALERIDEFDELVLKLTNECCDLIMQLSDDQIIAKTVSEGRSPEEESKRFDEIRIKAIAAIEAKENRRT